MVGQTKKFKKEYAVSLLAIAEGDLASSEGLLSIVKGRRENIIYLAQQAVEKALKAVTCAKGEPIPLTHDIETLIANLPKSVDKPEDIEALAALTEFATIRRYEEGFYEYTTEELHRVIEVSRATLNWAKGHIISI